MSRRKKEYKKRRTKLWLENPNCYWCKLPTILPIKPEHRNQYDCATLDHLNNRLSNKRTMPNHNNEIRTVLACRICNNIRGFLDWKRFNKNKLKEKK